MEGGTGPLLTQLIKLCDGGDPHFTLLQGSDRVGDGPAVATGRVNPLPLIAMLRGQIREELIERAIASLGHDLLRLCAPRFVLRRT